jgi:alkaline phosphatase D
MSQTMRAWQYKSVAGGIEKNLRINENAPKPVPGNNEILVQVHVMALNPVDYKMTESPAPLRLLGSTFIPGCDFCGKVTDVGKSVDGFAKGDYVFGAKRGVPINGTLAQYTVVNKDMAAKLPRDVKPEDAATVGVVGLTSYQAIKPNVKSGDKVFINGGSGGTGVYSIQIAKALGCHVTTTCSTPNVELCKSIGADVVIDYKSTDLIKALSSGSSAFNLVVDNVGTPSNLYKASSAFTAPGAKFMQIGMTPSLGGLVLVGGNMLLPGFLGGGKAKYQLVTDLGSTSDLEVIGRWMAEGKVKSILDSEFEWEDAPKAYERMKSGRTKGKIIIKVPQDDA